MLLREVLASFIYVCIIMTMNLSFLKSHEFSASTSDTPLDKLSMGFSLVTSRVILDQCNINIFVMVILHLKKCNKYFVYRIFVNIIVILCCCKEMSVEDLESEINHPAL